MIKAAWSQMVVGRLEWQRSSLELSTNNGEREDIVEPGIRDSSLDSGKFIWQTSFRQAIIDCMSMSGSIGHRGTGKEQPIEPNRYWKNQIRGEYDDGLSLDQLN